MRFRITDGRVGLTTDKGTESLDADQTYDFVDAALFDTDEAVEKKWPVGEKITIERIS